MASQGIALSEMELLPGILNEITLNHVTTKLPWGAFHVLSSVSRSWQLAIQRHQVYDARVRAQSTETRVVVNQLVTEDESQGLSLYQDEEMNWTGYVHRMALYSIQDKSCLQLPPIPHLGRGFPWSCQCISLDGKIYILGGLEDFSLSLSHGSLSHSASKKVYMLDLAGQGKWKQCASMREPRTEFGCGVLDGKIYVFGGHAFWSPVLGSEVYDPKVDAWSPITPLKKSGLKGHQITTVGEEEIVHGGDGFSGTTRPVIDYDDNAEGRRDGFFLGVSHPGKDEWRLVRSVGRSSLADVVMSEEKLHLMNHHCVVVYDMDEKPESQQHSISFSAVGPFDFGESKPYAIAVVDDEILDIWHLWSRAEESVGSCLLRGRGFASSNKPIVWQKEHSYFPSSNWPLYFSFFLHPMQL